MGQLFLALWEDDISWLSGDFQGRILEASMDHPEYGIWTMVMTT